MSYIFVFIVAFNLGVVIAAMLVAAKEPRASEGDYRAP